MSVATAAPRSRSTRPGAWQPALGVIVALLVVLIAGAAWRIGGGNWAVITTPSMGTAAPVGTLVITRPAQIASLKVGDVITYRPRNERDKIFTHRVISRSGDAVRVQGDINGAPDPFPVTQSDLVGKAITLWHGIGWILRALPTLALTGVVLFVATGRYVPVWWRSSVRIVGCCLVVAATVLILRPLVRPILIGLTTTAEGPLASVVSGGVLPTRVTGVDGHSIVLHAGQTGVVPVASTRLGGPMMINGSPDLHGWWLVAMIIVCLLPMLWSLLVGLSPATRSPRHEAGTP